MKLRYADPSDVPALHREPLPLEHPALAPYRDGYGFVDERTPHGGCTSERASRW